MVVDDEPGILRLVRLTLRLEGHEVETYQDPLAALQALRAGTVPDVVVLDLRMPGMDGREFYRAMRSAGYGPPVILLSAFGAEVAREELGAAAAMGKPFAPEELVRLVAELLSP